MRALVLQDCATRTTHRVDAGQGHTLEDSPPEFGTGQHFPIGYANFHPQT